MPDHRQRHLQQIKQTVERVAPDLMEEAETRILTDSEQVELQRQMDEREKAKEESSKRSRSEMLKNISDCAAKASDVGKRATESSKYDRKQIKK